MKQTKIEKTIDEAKLAIDNRKFNLAENRIYYAIFYIVNALVVLKDYTTSKHISLKGWFNKEIIFKEKMDIEISNLQ